MLFIHVCAHKFFYDFHKGFPLGFTYGYPRRITLRNTWEKISIKGKEDETKEVEKEKLLLCNT